MSGDVTIVSGSHKKSGQQELRSEKASALWNHCAWCRVWDQGRVVAGVESARRAWTWARGMVGREQEREREKV